MEEKMKKVQDKVKFWLNALNMHVSRSEDNNHNCQVVVVGTHGNECKDDVSKFKENLRTLIHDNYWEFLQIHREPLILNDARQPDEYLPLWEILDGFGNMLYEERKEIPMSFGAAESFIIQNLILSKQVRTLCRPDFVNEVERGVPEMKQDLNQLSKL